VASSLAVASTLDVRPDFPSDDIAHQRLRHAKCRGNVALRLPVKIPAPHLYCLIRRKFCARVILATAKSLRIATGSIPIAASDALRMQPRTVSISARLSTFGVAIGGVFRTCGQKKVRRVHALPVVARMAHAKPMWDWAMRQFPRNTMREQVSAMILHLP